MVAKAFTRYPARYLVDNWVSLDTGCPSPHIAIPMLAERLSNVRTLVHPDISWHRVSIRMDSLDLYQAQLDKFPEVFRLWLASGNAFEELDPRHMAPSIRQRLDPILAHPWEVANLLTEGPPPALLRDVYNPRALLWWHLTGMPVELLQELTSFSTIKVESTMNEGLDTLFQTVGFNLFAWRVDVASIIGGDMDIPYVRRLLLANSYAIRPLRRANSSWKKCILSLYYNDPGLLRQLKGTSPPHVPATVFWTRPRRDSIAPEEEEHSNEDKTI